MVLFLFLLKEHLGDDFRPIINNNKMQYCSKEEALLRLFYNLSTSFFLVFFFIFFSSILLFKFFYFLGSPLFPRSYYSSFIHKTNNPFFHFFFFLSNINYLFIFCRNEYEYEYNMSSEEEEEEEEKEEEGYGNGIIYGEGETVSFLDEEAETRMSRWQQSQLPDEEILLTDLEEPWLMKSTDPDGQITTNSSVYESPQASEPDQHYQQDEDDKDDDQMPKELTVSLR